MLVVPEKRLVFLLPMKVGSLSLIEAMKPFGGYIDPKNCDHHHKSRYVEKLKDYHWVLMVRHPYTHMFSLWNFIMDHAKRGPKIKKNKKISFWYDCFPHAHKGKVPGLEEFVSDPSNKYMPRHVVSQFQKNLRKSHWRCAWHLEQIKPKKVDSIVHFERYYEEITALPGLSDLPEIVNVNKTSETKYPWYEYFTPKVVEKVQSYWGNEFEEFGYTRDFGQVRQGNYFLGNNNDK